MHAPVTRRPTITLAAGDLHRIATEAEAALIAASAPIYQRGGLVRPVVEDVAAAAGHRTKVARLTQVKPATIIDHLSRVADFQRFNVRKADYVRADPPKEVADTILSRDGEWKFRRLSGLITTPTLRPDGSILSTPGYDPATRLLLLDPPAMPAIPDAPTREHALAALDLLDRLLDGFPFVDDASRSVGLSALITPIVRGALPVGPLHAVTAPASGTGKSFLIDVSSGVLTGDRAPVLSVGDKAEETEKRITAALLDGQAIVSIDNINGEFYSDLLCQAVERPLVSLRPLGGSQLVKIENRATFFATGNNLKLVSDMARRTIVCSLDSKIERPELREFSGNPFSEVISNRGKYIAAALTVVRAYVVAGCPGTLPPLASFEAWSRLVRSALVWLGRADPVATQEAARADDPGVADLKALMLTWTQAVGSEARSTKAIVAASTDRNMQGELIHEDLRDALMAVAADKRGTEVDPLRLGKYLGRNKGRVIADLRLAADKDTRTKQPVWTVETCGGQRG